jgi:hypothetical protein
MCSPTRSTIYEKEKRRRQGPPNFAIVTGSVAQAIGVALADPCIKAEKDPRGALNTLIELAQALVIPLRLVVLSARWVMLVILAEGIALFSAAGRQTSTGTETAMMAVRTTLTTPR